MEGRVVPISFKKKDITVHIFVMKPTICIPRNFSVFFFLLELCFCWFCCVFFLLLEFKYSERSSAPE